MGELELWKELGAALQDLVPVIFEGRLKVVQGGDRPLEGLRRDRSVADQQSGSE